LDGAHGPTMPRCDSTKRLVGCKLGSETFVFLHRPRMVDAFAKGCAALRAPAYCIDRTEAER
ncbi:MAG: hypothetical protein ACP5O6_13155, partial [Candidatus Baltobacteraceae bacterium]